MPRVVRLNVVFVEDLCFLQLFILAKTVANEHVELYFISKRSLRSRRMKLANWYFPSEGLSACATHRKVPRSENCVVAGRLFVGLNHCNGNCNVVGRWAPTAFVDAFPEPSIWDVLDVPQSDPIRACWRCVWIGLEAMFRPKSLAEFRPKVWPNFGQNFWSDFGQNLGRFPTQKMFTSGFLL